MYKDAGFYPDYLERLERTVSKNTSNGQDEETFTGGASLWCRVEVTNGRRQKDYGADQTGADATIYVRNADAELSPLDRLQDEATGEVWIIDSIAKNRDADELVCEAYLYDELDL